MKRAQLYNEIKNLNLQDEVKAVTGDNYTRATNAQLKSIIDNAVAGLKKPKEVKSNIAFIKLVEVLSKKKILLTSEVDAIMNV